MDEEDLAEAAESRQLETAGSFATIGRVGGSYSDALFGLFVTEEETMGVKIAQKLGWRRDQGVGPKIRRKALIDDDAAGAQDTPSAHMFAPRDSRIMSVAREKPNRKGLGFQSEARLVQPADQDVEDRPMLALPFRQESSKLKTTKKATPSKSSFGVGVLNDTGSDDEDPYEIGPKITFNRTIGKEKKAKKPSKFAKSGTGEKLLYMPKKASGKASSLNQLSYDGRPPLQGFVLAVRPIELKSTRKYPPPKIPSGWKSAKAGAQPTTTQAYQSVADAAKTSKLDSKGRASLLGESPLPGKSVFDFISKDARDRLAALTGKTDLPPGLGQSAPQEHQASGETQTRYLWSFVPTLEKSTAEAALAKGATGWMPYSENPAKRARYIGFLELRAGLRQDLPERSDGVSVPEWSKELKEFAHAAEVFRPASGFMASRFTSSTSSSHAGGENNASDANLLRKPMKKPEDPADEAARLGMFGPMTRSCFPFFPSRLLCKRFNVKPPADMPPDADTGSDRHGAMGKTEEALSKSTMDEMMHEVLTKGAPALQRPAWMNAPAQESTPSTSAATVHPSEQQREHAKVDVEKNDALTQERASDDVFKAIFGDDDEDEDDNDE